MIDALSEMASLAGVAGRLAGPAAEDDRTAAALDAGTLGGTSLLGVTNRRVLGAFRATGEETEAVAGVGGIVVDAGPDLPSGTMPEDACSVIFLSIVLFVSMPLFAGEILVAAAISSAPGRGLFSGLEVVVDGCARVGGSATGFLPDGNLGAVASFDGNAGVIFGELFALTGSRAGKSSACRTASSFEALDAWAAISFDNPLWTANSLMLFLASLPPCGTSASATGGFCPVTGLGLSSARDRGMDGRLTRTEAGLVGGRGACRPASPNRTGGCAWLKSSPAGTIGYIEEGSGDSLSDTKASTDSEASSRGSKSSSVEYISSPRNVRMDYM